MANEILDRLGITAENYKAPKKRENDTLNNGPLGHFVDAVEAGGASVIGGQARTLGEYAPFGNRTLNNVADYLKEIAEANTPTKELNGVDWGAQALGNMVGSMVPLALEAWGASKIAGPAGGRAVLRGASKVPLLGNAVSGLGQLNNNIVGKAILANLGGGIFEIPAEMGDVIETTRERGASKEEVDKAALRSGLANLAYNTTTGLAEATMLGKLVGSISDVAKKGKYSVAKSAGLGAVGEGFKQGLDETVQSAIGDWAKGDPIDWANAIEEGKMGGFGGLFLGGIGGGAGRYINNRIEEEEAKKLLEENTDQTEQGDNNEIDYGVEKPQYTQVNTGEFVINPAELRVARQLGLDNVAGDRYARLMSTLADRGQTPAQQAVQQPIAEETAQPVVEAQPEIPARPSNIAVRGERGLGNIGASRSQAQQPSGNIPASAPNRNYEQELVNRYYGRPINFRKDFNKAMEAIASAYRMGRMSEAEAQERALALADIYRRVIEPIKNGVGRENTTQTAEQQPQQEQMLPQQPLSLPQGTEQPIAQQPAQTPPIQTPPSGSDTGGQQPTGQQPTQVPPSGGTTVQPPTGQQPTQAPPTTGEGQGDTVTPPTQQPSGQPPTQTPPPTGSGQSTPPSGGYATGQTVQQPSGQQQPISGAGQQTEGQTNGDTSQTTQQPRGTTTTQRPSGGSSTGGSRGGNVGGGSSSGGGTSGSSTGRKPIVLTPQQREAARKKRERIEASKSPKAIALKSLIELVKKAGITVVTDPEAVANHLISRGYTLVGDWDGVKNYIVQSPFGGQGEWYGDINTQTGVMHLDVSVEAIDSIIHEYTHMWNSIMRVTNPELWKRGVDLVKSSQQWTWVKNSPAYARLRTDDDIADEVIARLVGPNGEQVLTQLAIGQNDPQTFIKRVRNWIKDFWYALKNVFSNWGSNEAQSVTLEEFQQLPLVDLFNGVDLQALKKAFPSGNTYVVPDTSPTMDEARAQASRNQAENQQRGQAESDLNTGNVRDTAFGPKGANANALLGGTSSSASASKPRPQSTTRGTSRRNAGSRVTQTESDIMGELSGLFKFGDSSKVNDEFKDAIKVKFNPKAVTALSKLGMLKYDGGLTTYPEWREAMVATLGQNANVLENAKPWIGAVWKAIEKFPSDQAFNDSKMSVAFDFVGASYQSGNLILSDVVQDFKDTTNCTDEQLEGVMPYLESAYSGIREYNIPTLEGGADNDSDSGQSDTGTNTVDGETDDENGATNDGEKPDDGDGSGIQTTGTTGLSSGGATGVSSSGDSSSGTQPTGEGEGEVSDDSSNSPDGNNSGTSGGNSGSGLSADGQGSGATDETSDNGQVDEEDLKLTNKLLKQVNKTMSFLTDLQKNNVVHAIKRMFFKNLQALLLTDGTGTGKTFSGLGLVKSAIDHYGAKRVLVITPNDTIYLQWQDAAKKKGFNIQNIKGLESMKDGGKPFVDENGKPSKDQKGVYLTTYANLRGNDEIFKHNWDLVICDEAHNLMSSQDASDTAGINRLRALTLNPRGLEDRATILLTSDEEREAVERSTKLNNLVKRLESTIRKRERNHTKDASWAIPPTIKDYLWFEEEGQALTLLGYENPLKNEKGYSQILSERVKAGKITYAESQKLYKEAVERLKRGDNVTKTARLAEARANDLVSKGIKIRQNAPEVKVWKEMPVSQRPKVLFLSATPFTYHRTTDWAEGYLFDYKEPTEDMPNPQYGFLVDTFGYSVKPDKNGNLQLYEPNPAEVDTTENEIDFHEGLRDAGALRGEILSIDKDYNRGFVVTTADMSDADSIALGKFIDDGFKLLRQNYKYNVLSEELKSQFTKSAQSDLLESLKAKAAMQLAREYAKAGKKVVIAHRRRQDTTIVNPFVLDKSRISQIEAKDPDRAKEVKRQMAQFALEYPEYVNKNFADLRTPLGIFQDETTGFKDGEAVYYNGAVGKKGQAEAVKLFQDDNSGVNILVGQVNAIREGINFQDTTGKHPRVLINISIPQSPSEFTQVEGRIYRTGNASNAIFRYLSTGTNFENMVWASVVASRVETAENLSLGSRARNMLRSIVKAFAESLTTDWKKYLPNTVGEDVGGRAIDFSHPKNDGFASAIADYNESANYATPAIKVPEPLGYAMVQWAKAVKGEKLLDFNAGRANISRYFSSRNTNVIIEPDPDLAVWATMLTKNQHFIDGTFGAYSTVTKFDGIISSPLDIEQVVKAFHHLKDGGRIVAVVEDTKANNEFIQKWLVQDEEFNNRLKMLANWFKEDSAKTAYLTHEINLPSIAFERSGKPKMKVLIIDKHIGPRLDIDTKQIQIQEHQNINDFFADLKGLVEGSDVVNARIPIDDKVAKDIKKNADKLRKIREKVQANEEIVNARYSSDRLKELACIDDTVNAILGFTLDSYTYSAKKNTDYVPKALYFIDNENVTKPIGRISKWDRKYHYSLRSENLTNEETLAQAQLELLKRAVVRCERVSQQIDDVLLERKVRANLMKPYEAVRKQAIAEGKEINKNYDTVIIETASNGDRIISVIAPDIFLDEHVADVNWGNYKKYYQGDKTWRYTDTDNWGFNNLVNAIGRNLNFSINREVRRLIFEAQKPTTQEPNAKFSINPITLNKLPERTVKEIENEINASFPNLKKIEYRDTDIIVTLPNDLRIQINVVSDQIIVDEESYIRGRGDHGLNSEQDGYIEGMWRTVNKSDINGLLAVSVHSRKGTTYHEVMHFAMDMCLSEKERQALYKASIKEAKKTNRDVDEVIADNYRDWVIARQKGRGTTFGRLFQKIKDFLYKIQALFTATENAYNVMRKVESGEVWNNVKEERDYNNAMRFSHNEEMARFKHFFPAKSYYFSKSYQSLINENIETWEKRDALWKKYSDLRKQVEAETTLEPLEKALERLKVTEEKYKDDYFTRSLVNDLRRKTLSDKGNRLKEEADLVYAEYSKVDAELDVIRKKFERKIKYERKKQLDSYEYAGTKPTPTQRVDFDGFSITKVGASYYDDILEGMKRDENGYLRSDKAYLAEMTPKEYIQRCAMEIFDQSTFESCASAGLTPEGSIDKYAKMMREGVKFDLPYLSYEGNWQEGRHRAMAAEVNGIKTIPVLIVTAPNVRFSINPTKTLNEKLAGSVVSATERDALPNFREGGIKTATDWVRSKVREFYTDWVDKNDVLHDVDKAYEQALGRKLGDEERVYDKAQMHNASSAGMADALINGDANSIKAINERLKNKKLSNSVTLRDVISALDKDTLDKTYPNYLEQLGCKQWYEAFSKYLGWRRLAEMSRLHKEAFNEELAQWEKDKAEQDDWKAYDKAKTKAYNQWLANGKQGENPIDAMRENWLKHHDSEAEPHPDLGNKPTFKPYLLPENLTEQELMEGIRNAPPVFKKAAQMYYMFNDNILTIMEDAGMISAELHNLLNKKYKEYCPLMRDFSDTASFDKYIGELSFGGKGYGNVSSTLKRISEEGSERAVISPLESTIKAVAVAMNRAERNKVGLQIIEMAKKAKLDEFIQEIPTPKGGNAVADPNNCIFTVMVDGKKKAYRSSQELYGPIVGYNLPSASFSFGIVRNAAQLLRTGATMSPSFIIRNVLRDTVFAGISSQNGFIPFVDTIKGAYALYKNAEMSAKFNASGVNKFNFYATDKAVIESLNELAGGRDWNKATPYEILKAGLKYSAVRMVALSNFMESATRMGEFMRAYEKTGDIDISARAGKEITLDFSRSGIYGEQWNQIIPFLNACIQGGDKVYRLLKNEPIKTMTNIGKYIILPSMVLWALNHDEEWYKELDPAIKQNNWCIGEYRIPKPQEVGVLFGSGVEAMLELAWKNDPKAVGTWIRLFIQNSVPNFVPTVLLPIMEWKANYSFHRGRELVGGKYQSLPDELQFTPYTSEASKGIGEVTGLSPIKLDNFIRGHTGTMGMLLWQASMDWKKDGLPERRWSELPILRDFNVTAMNRSKDVNMFYDMLDKANKEHAGYGTSKHPSPALSAIRKISTTISKVNKEILAITLNDKISPERKRKLIDIRDDYRRKIAKRANEMYGKYF